MQVQWRFWNQWNWHGVVDCDYTRAHPGAHPGAHGRNGGTYAFPHLDAAVHVRSAAAGSLAELIGRWQRGIYIIYTEGSLWRM